MYALVLTSNIRCSFEEQQSSAEYSETPHRWETPFLTLHARRHTSTHQLTLVAFASSICAFKRSTGLAKLLTDPSGAGSVASLSGTGWTSSAVNVASFVTAFSCFLARFFLFLRAVLLGSSQGGVKGSRRKTVLTQLYANISNTYLPAISNFIWVRPCGYEQ